jgi:hypothetical protein
MGYGFFTFRIVFEVWGSPYNTIFIDMTLFQSESKVLLLFSYKLVISYITDNISFSTVYEFKQKYQLPWHWTCGHVVQLTK